MSLFPTPPFKYCLVKPLGYSPYLQHHLPNIVQHLLVSFYLARRPRPNPTPALTLTLWGAWDRQGEGACFSRVFPGKHGRPNASIDQLYLGVARIYFKGGVAIRDPSLAVYVFAVICNSAAAAADDSADMFDGIYNLPGPALYAPFTVCTAPAPAAVHPI